MDKALETQLANIEKRTGNTLDELTQLVKHSGLTKHARLEALPPGGMCQYRVKITAASEVDRELVAWIRQAYDAAG